MSYDDDREWDDIMNDEDNYYDKPDETFMNECNAEKAGYRLGYDDIVYGDITNLERDIVYPSMASDEAINAFKHAYRKGRSDAVDKLYGYELEYDYEYYCGKSTDNGLNQNIAKPDSKSRVFPDDNIINQEDITECSSFSPFDCHTKEMLVFIDGDYRLVKREKISPLYTDIAEDEED